MTDVVAVPEDAIDPDIAGPVFARPGAPPIECRRIPREPCFSGGDLDEAVFGDRIGDVARVVLTCQAARCDDLNGDYRVDLVLRDGSTTPLGAGGYSTSEAAP